MRNIAAALVAITIVVASASAAAAQQSQQVAKGETLYKEFCQSCHGADGQKGDAFHSPIWGPQAQIGQKFKNAQELLEYLQLAMPFDDPNKVNDLQRRDILMYMLVKHGALKPTDNYEPRRTPSIPLK